MIAVALLLVGQPGLAAGWDPGRAAPISHAPFPARTISVSDGDTVVVIDRDGTKHRIRIAGIDAPEKGQPYGEAARSHLGELLAGRTAQVEPIKRDPFGRTVANLRIDGADVGLEMVRAGLAWHFVRYAQDQTPAERDAYARAEQQAREDRAGLWRDPAPEAPWAHRDRMRRQQAGQAASR